LQVSQLFTCLFEISGRCFSFFPFYAGWPIDRNSLFPRQEVPSTIEREEAPLHTNPCLAFPSELSGTKVRTQALFYLRKLTLGPRLFAKHVESPQVEQTHLSAWTGEKRKFLLSIVLDFLL